MLATAETGFKARQHRPRNPHALGDIRLSQAGILAGVQQGSKFIIKRIVCFTKSRIGFPLLCGISLRVEYDSWPDQ